MSDESKSTLSLSATDQGEVKATKPKRRTPAKTSASKTSDDVKPAAQTKSDDLGQQIDDVAGRLESGAAECLKGWKNWADSGDSAAQQGLSESVHSLRRVLARIDIIMAKAKRQDRDQKRIPVPKHRSA